MLVGQAVTQAWSLGEERFFKSASDTHVAFRRGTPMNSDAAKEATVVPISVQRYNSVLVTKPIRKTPNTEVQRVAAQDFLFFFYFFFIGLFQHTLQV